MIYLDNAATTPCSELVLDAMIPFFRNDFGNASSIDHAAGSRAKRAVDNARSLVADLVGAKPEDVIFTSGSTEANNLALSSARSIITTAIEHPSVLDVVRNRARPDDGVLPVDERGFVDITAAEEAMRGSAKNAIVSIIATNNEIGVEQDVERLVELANLHNVPIHFDATQAVGTRAFDMRKAGISALSLSAHKIYGPKGVGALVCTANMRAIMRPILYGGGHERGFRSGTLNVPGIVGFGEACRLLASSREQRRSHLHTLRQVFIDAIARYPGVEAVPTIQHGAVSPHVLSLRIVGVNGRALLRAVQGQVAFSLGSACATNKAEPSHVLQALHVPKSSIAETIRVSFSIEQSADEIKEAAARIAAAARDLLDYSVVS